MSDINNHDLWAGDLFARKEDAKRLSRFINNAINARKKKKQPAHLVLNIDSKWGGGKTFLLEKFVKQTIDQNGSAIYVDAWVSDHGNDPLVPILSALQSFLEDNGINSKKPKIFENIIRNAAPILRTVALGSLKHAAKRAIGDFGDEINDLVLSNTNEDSEADNKSQHQESSHIAGDTISAGLSAGVKALDKLATQRIKDFNEVNKSIQGFRTTLAETANALSELERKGPLIIVIDELDRCRPNYAISLLEIAKHLFEVEGVVFVIATDTEQLEHSIRSVYGSGFDAHTYLQRFFNQTFKLKSPSFENLVKSYFALGKFAHFTTSYERSQKVYTEKSYLSDVYLVNTILKHTQQTPRSVKHILDIVENVTLNLSERTIINLPILVSVICFSLSDNFNNLTEMIKTVKDKNTIFDKLGHNGRDKKRSIQELLNTWVNHCSDPNSTFDQNTLYLSDYSMLSPIRNTPSNPDGTRTSIVDMYTSWVEEFSAYN